MNATVTALLCVLGFCGDPGQAVFALHSAGPAKSYGILVNAPQATCAFARFEVTDSAGRRMRTPPLAPGELALVRMGRGYPQGLHLLQVRATGCAQGTPRVSRVVLERRGPDHGWRSDALMR